MKGQIELSLQRFEAVGRPSLINQERLVHGNWWEGGGLSLERKGMEASVVILLLTHKHRFTIRFVLPIVLNFTKSVLVGI